MQKNTISQERSSLAKTKILTNMLCHAGQFIMQQGLFNKLGKELLGGQESHRTTFSFLYSLNYFERAYLIQTDGSI